MVNKLEVSGSKQTKAILSYLVDKQKDQSNKLEKMAPNALGAFRDKLIQLSTDVLQSQTKFFKYFDVIMRSQNTTKTSGLDDPMNKNILNLKVKGFKHKEIAQKLNVQETFVNSRIKKIKALLDPDIKAGMKENNLDFTSNKVLENLDQILGQEKLDELLS